MMTEDGDRNVLDDVPFVRHGPSSELWPRIAASAGAAHRRQRLRTWSWRIASMAAGLVLWLAVNAIRERFFAPSLTQETLVRDERAWLSDSLDELPPEAQLVTALVAGGGER